MASRGEIRFQRVRIWWQLGDLAEDVRQVDGDDEGNEVQTAVGHTKKKGCEDNLVVRLRVPKER